MLASLVDRRRQPEDAALAVATRCGPSDLHAVEPGDWMRGKSNRYRRPTNPIRSTLTTLPDIVLIRSTDPRPADRGHVVPFDSDFV
jgi:hypothetical protein